MGQAVIDILVIGDGARSKAFVRIWEEEGWVLGECVKDLLLIG